ncbi:hypothetical protein SynA1825c_01246 [Synechococcus sp. A18-25c]|uniref:hypothetical protein n=1 Tax=Synechococcus sp. A18-25c TaxID=1866938 RepID=UPI00185FDDB3|nr:hypothetical protein [Synechococcus sp. A18-25c]QNJ19553.1 hypothetical protein SynA1825c_01246 [Synechococcus sp. A18-25c]
MSVVTLLSDFIDGTSMALSEHTDQPSLNDYMTSAAGQLWAGTQQRRLRRNLTRQRRGPGTLFFAPNDKANASVTAYLQSETGSSQEAAWQERMQQQGVEIAPHVGDAHERQVLVKGESAPVDPSSKSARVRLNDDDSGGTPRVSRKTRLPSWGTGLPFRQGATFTGCSHMRSSCYILNFL